MQQPAKKPTQAPVLGQWYSTEPNAKWETWVTRK